MKNIIRYLCILIVICGSLSIVACATEKGITIHQENNIISWDVSGDETFIRNYELYFYSLDLLDTGNVKDNFIGMYKTPNKEFDLSDIRFTVSGHNLLLGIVAVDFDDVVIYKSDLIPVVESIHSDVNDVTGMPTVAHVGTVEYKVAGSALKQEKRCSIFTNVSDDKTIISNINDMQITFAKPGIAKLRVTIKAGTGLTDYTEDFTITVYDSSYAFDETTGILTILTEDGFKDWKNEVKSNAVKKVVLSSEVADVPKAAFKNCKNLEIVCIERQYNDVSIGDQAFYNCTKLTGDGCQIYSFIRKVDYIGDSAFYNCKNLSKVKFRADTLQYIGKNAFYNCKSIQDILFCEACHVDKVTFKVQPNAFKGISPNGIVHFTDDIAVQSLKEAFSKGGMQFDDKTWQVEVIDYSKDFMTSFDTVKERVKFFQTKYVKVETWEELQKILKNGESNFISIDITKLKNKTLPSTIIKLLANSDSILQISNEDDVIILFGKLLKPSSKDIDLCSISTVCELKDTYVGCCIKNDELILLKKD